MIAQMLEFNTIKNHLSPPQPEPHSRKGRRQKLQILMEGFSQEPALLPMQNRAAVAHRPARLRRNKRHRIQRMSSCDRL